jgi:hypothetical protein
MSRSTEVVNRLVRVVAARMSLSRIAAITSRLLASSLQRGCVTGVHGGVAQLGEARQLDISRGP